MDLSRRDAVRRSQLDAVSALTVYLATLFLVESRLVIGPLGGAGRPAFLVACASLAWWAYHHVQRPLPTGVGPEPLRRALLAMTVAFLASFVAAMTRPITGLESGTAHLGLLTVLSWMGVALLTLDGVPTFVRMDTLITRVVVAGAFLGTLGVAQFVTGDPLVRALSLPGLVGDDALPGLGMRNGFTRPFGTALHPIEYGAVISMLLPLAISWAHRPSARPWLLSWAPAALMGFGVVVSVSRSALICAGAALIVVAAGWQPRARRMLVAAVAGIFVFVAIAVPGMLGSIRGLFVTAGTDNSVASRTGSYPFAWEFFETAPFFGRGYSTFLPMYRIFDNQYLLLLVEVGVVGLVTVLAVLVAGIDAARRTRRLTSDPVLAEHAQALAAGLVGGSLGLAFYDGFSFPMATGVMFLLLGMAGALYRLVRYGEVHERIGPRDDSSPEPVPAPDGT
ncbi:O-antigen ligase family protein [Nocardioides donggukensis]|uniref:O-antigen ligase family protein n=1 Tax=Nocardioides donggukensis TaxID=2774019 RepID=A0A927Q3D1_9ACTN|nr:O-antigen ligase family protein [Nocardioides donggukensis]MBD8870481.1 O-antigen ligase family protein [Nocardioides donggukensis]